MDLFSRKIIGWATRSTIHRDLVLDAIMMAVKGRHPCGTVIHSDQGSQYGSDDWRRFCLNNNLQPSMSRRGNCWDNAVAESFFGCLKKERVKKHIYKNPRSRDRRFLRLHRIVLQSKTKTPASWRCQSSGVRSYSDRMMSGVSTKPWYLQIPIRTQKQREVLDRARVLTGIGSLIPAQKTYIQQLRLYEGQCIRAGLSKMHGLRHAYAQRRYEEITGFEAPIAGGPSRTALSIDDRALDRKSRATRIAGCIKSSWPEQRNRRRDFGP